MVTVKFWWWWLDREGVGFAHRGGGGGGVLETATICCKGELVDVPEIIIIILNLNFWKYLNNSILVLLFRLFY